MDIPKQKRSPKRKPSKPRKPRQDQKRLKIKIIPNNPKKGSARSPVKGISPTKQMYAFLSHCKPMETHDDKGEVFIPTTPVPQEETSDQTEDQWEGHRQWMELLQTESRPYSELDHIELEE